MHSGRVSLFCTTAHPTPPLRLKRLAEHERGVSQRQDLRGGNRFHLQRQGAFAGLVAKPAARGKCADCAANSAQKQKVEFGYPRIACARSAFVIPEHPPCHRVDPDQIGQQNKADKRGRRKGGHDGHVWLVTGCSALASIHNEKTVVFFTDSSHREIIATFFTKV